MNFGPDIRRIGGLTDQRIVTLSIAISPLLNSFLRPGTPLKGFLTHAQRLYLFFILFTKPLLTYKVLEISTVEKPSM
jgi:hypothetical protein